MNVTKVKLKKRNPDGGKIRRECDTNCKQGTIRLRVDNAIVPKKGQKGFLYLRKETNQKENLTYRYALLKGGTGRTSHVSVPVRNRVVLVEKGAVGGMEAHFFSNPR